MKNLNSKKGFTLLEALVAISILMVAVSAPITIAQKGLSSAVYSKDQMIASYLAQDAIEYIKNRRDEVTINDDNFDWDDLSVFNNCLVDSITNRDVVGCQVDTITGDIDIYSSSNKLKKDLNNFYQYSDGDDTKFTRQIQIELIDVDGTSDDGALVDVTIRWGTGDQYLNVETLIYNY